MTIAEELEARGFAKGYAQGLAEARAEGLAEAYVVFRHCIEHALESRGLSLSAAERVELDRIADLGSLNQILVRATAANTVSEALKAEASDATS